MAPRLCAQVQEAALSGDYRTALELQDRLVPLHAAMFAEPSPACPKYGLSRLGMVRDELRLPMLPATATARGLMDHAMAHAGLALG